MLLIHGYVELVASNGQVLRLSSKAAGVATGFARIGNPYFDGDPDWRFKDGDTCIECSESDHRGMPVADAYQSLYRLWAQEQCLFDDMLRQDNQEISESIIAQEWEAREGALYHIQDKLMGVG